MVTLIIPEAQIGLIGESNQNIPESFQNMIEKSEDKFWPKTH